MKLRMGKSPSMGLVLMGYYLSCDATYAQQGSILIDGMYAAVDYCPSEKDALLPFHDVYGPHPVNTWQECAQVCDYINNPHFIHVPNTYCEYYKHGGDGPCEDGKPFDEVWQMCKDDGPKCMGIMWNSCTGPTSDRSVNGAWKLMSAGQTVGDADHPTETCGGKNQALGHWDVFLRSDDTEPIVHVPNTYCKYYKHGDHDGSCETGKPFDEVWQMCKDDGPKCMGIMWSSCNGLVSDRSVNGSWKLMSAGQTVGDADHPTETCGGKNQALGHWDVFLKFNEPIVHVPNTYCKYYKHGDHDGSCETGKPFDEVWQMCMNDGPKCMGVMWSSCNGLVSDRSVNGSWKLMSAGQTVGDADHPTETCGGKDQALGHWDVFLRSDYRKIHVPNTYCKSYDYGGAGSCEAGKPFDEVWQMCMNDGPEKCMGIMWNSCEGPTSDTNVNGAWQLMTAGQTVGDADHPTETCGGKNQALGHWDVFLRSDNDKHDCQFAYFKPGDDISECYIYGRKLINPFPLQYEPTDYQTQSCKTSVHGDKTIVDDFGGKYVLYNHFMPSPPPPSPYPTLSPVKSPTKPPNNAGQKCRHNWQCTGGLKCRCKNGLRVCLRKNKVCK